MRRTLDIDHVNYELPIIMCRSSLQGSEATSVEKLVESSADWIIHLFWSEHSKTKFLVKIRQSFDKNIKWFSTIETRLCLKVPFNTIFEA